MNKIKDSVLLPNKEGVFLAMYANKYNDAKSQKSYEIFKLDLGLRLFQMYKKTKIINEL